MILDSLVVVGMTYNTTGEMNSIVDKKWFVNSRTVAGIVNPTPLLLQKDPVKIVFKKLKV